MKEWKKGKKGKKLWEDVAPEDKERMKNCFKKLKIDWKKAKKGGKKNWWKKKQQWMEKKFD